MPRERKFAASLIDLPRTAYTFVRDKAVTHTVLNSYFVALMNPFNKPERTFNGILPLAFREQTAALESLTAFVTFSPSKFKMLSS